MAISTFAIAGMSVHKQSLYLLLCNYQLEAKSRGLLQFQGATVDDDKEVRLNIDSIPEHNTFVRGNKFAISTWESTLDVPDRVEPKHVLHRSYFECDLEDYSHYKVELVDGYGLGRGNHDLILMGREHLEKLLWAQIYNVVNSWIDMLYTLSEERSAFWGAIEAAFDPRRHELVLDALAIKKPSDPSVRRLYLSGEANTIRLKTDAGSIRVIWGQLIREPKDREFVEVLQDLTSLMLL